MSTSKTKQSLRYSECIRCGACCIMGPCSFGEEDSVGACKHLYFEGDTAVCPFIKDGDRKTMEAVEFGRGCVMRGKAGLEDFLNEKVKTFRRHMNI